MNKLNNTTFGVGRDKFRNVVSVNKFNYTPFSDKDPGPGWYNPKTPEKLRYSLRPRTACDSK